MILGADFASWMTKMSSLSWHDGSQLLLRKSYIRYNTSTLPLRAILGAPHVSTARYPMVSPSAKEVFILGVTQNGRPFRPSDWAERLAGVMSSFRPGGAVPGSHLSYSPWCIPNTIDGNKCVIIHTDLREAEPMAWDFVMNFARDNELKVVEA